jgi:acyl-CoA synthetase (AMP-forming)/AMP-acid ligase II
MVERCGRPSRFARWININYRYVEDELRYLFDNADLKALVYQRQFAPRVADVLPAMPLLRHTIVIEDGSGEDYAALGSVPYEEAVASGSPARDFAPRSADDRYILYTGGTTGMPKGVVWRHEDVFMALGGGIDPMTNVRAERPEFMVEKATMGVPLTFLPIAPLMHGATQWAVMGQSFLGNRSSSWGLSASRLGARRASGRSVDHRRRHGAPADRSARGARRRVGRVVALPPHVERGDVLPVGEGPVLRALPEPDDDRRRGLVGRRQCLQLVDPPP